MRSGKGLMMYKNLKEMFVRMLLIVFDYSLETLNFSIEYTNSILFTNDILFDKIVDGIVFMLLEFKSLLVNIKKNIHKVIPNL